jgi:hypothetical protein
MKNIIALIIMTIISCSCDDKSDKLKPAFSNYTIMFNKEGGDTLIYSLRDDWSFYEYLKIDGVTTSLPHCDEVFTDEGYKNGKPGECSNESLTVKYDSLSNRLEPIIIEGSWFKILKKTTKQVSIIISSNLTGNNREVRLTPDYSGTSLTISQSSN